MNVAVRAVMGLFALVLSSHPAAAEAGEGLQIGGRLMLDTARRDDFWSAQADGAKTNFEVRGARVEFSYDFAADWTGNVQIDFRGDEDDTDTDTGNLYLRYTGWDVAELTLGKMKEPAGLERNIKGARLLLPERSMVTDAFTANKNWGVHLSSAEDGYLWAVALTVADDQDDLYVETPPYALSARYVWAPVRQDRQRLQIGASLSVRDWHENAYQIRSRAELGTGDGVIRGEAFLADRQTVVGAEALWQRDSLLVTAEYLVNRVGEAGGADREYRGYYVTGSYPLGGLKRPVSDNRVGQLSADRGAGAFEVVARVGYLDARAAHIGSTATVATIGANYYYGEHLKVMVAYQRADGDHPDGGGDAVTLRVQLH